MRTYVGDQVSGRASTFRGEADGCVANDTGEKAAPPGVNYRNTPNRPQSDEHHRDAIGVEHDKRNASLQRDKRVGTADREWRDTGPGARADLPARDRTYFRPMHLLGECEAIAQLGKTQRVGEDVSVSVHRYRVIAHVRRKVQGLVRSVAHAASAPCERHQDAMRS